VKYSAEAIENIRVGALNRDNTNRIVALPKGEQHWNYKKNPSKLALHKRLYKKYGKASEFDCVDCPKKAADWSNETGDYTDDVKDYRPRCRSCHLKLDRNLPKVLG
jgi:hypothetical protein